MKSRTSAAIAGPSIPFMMLFIAAPFAGVFVHGFQFTRAVYETIEIESCTPGLVAQNCVIDNRTRPLAGDEGILVSVGEFVGLGSYRNDLELKRLAEALDGFSRKKLMGIDFRKALRFSVAFALIALSPAWGTGLAIAMAVISVARTVRGQAAFVSPLRSNSMCSYAGKLARCRCGRPIQLLACPLRFAGSIASARCGEPVDGACNREYFKSRGDFNGSGRGSSRGRIRFRASVAARHGFQKQIVSGLTAGAVRG
ncbi:MAG: hypothetical protein OXI87_03255 [Albidovulum sp.]|nr:hypothetical protein [Albidovulum sp.]